MEAEETCCIILLSPHNFPGKLWHLVNDPQICSVCWDASGEGILIQQQRFEAEVLFSSTKRMNKYFKTTDFSSFIRQLNLYGFRKVRPDHDVSETQLEDSSITAQLLRFQNPNFKRDKPDLLANLKRFTPVNKAKLAAGEKLNSRASKHFHHVRMHSLQENSAVMKNGSVSVSHHGTPYHHQCYGPQLVKQCDRMPKSSQTFVVGHGEPSHLTLLTNKVEPVSMFCHFLKDSSCAHASSPVHMKHRFYKPVYQCCTPSFMDSKVPISQSPVQMEYSVSYVHPAQQSPDWKAGDAAGSRTSDMIVNLDTVFKLADEMQAAANSQRSF